MERINAKNIAEHIENAKKYVESNVKKLTPQGVKEIKGDPNKSYVYVFYEGGKVVYIGKSEGKGLNNRLKQHIEGAADSVSTKNEEIKNATNEITIAILEIEPSSFNSTIETELISAFKPKWNQRKS